MTTATTKLLSGYEMPLVGAGTYKLTGIEVIYQVLDESLRIGFRSIDTAAVYQNKENIGIILTAYFYSVIKWTNSKKYILTCL